MSDEERDLAQEDIDMMIAEGLMIPTNVYDENGDQLYRFDHERLSILYPALEEIIRQAEADELDLALAGLYAKGLVDMEITEDGKTKYTLTDLGEQAREVIIEDEVQNLTNILLDGLSEG